MTLHLMDMLLLNIIGKLYLLTVTLFLFIHSSEGNWTIDKFINKFYLFAIAKFNLEVIFMVIITDDVDHVQFYNTFNLQKQPLM